MKGLSYWIYPNGEMLQIGQMEHSSVARELGLSELDMHMNGWVSLSASFVDPVVTGRIDSISEQSKDMILKWWEANATNKFFQNDLVDEIKNERGLL